MTVRHLFTCPLCGRADHLEPECPDPCPRDLVGYVCRHAEVPQVIRPGFHCHDDEPVYEGDTVATDTRYATSEISGVLRTTATVTVQVHRGCRADRDGKPGDCRLGAGHRTVFNHSPHDGSGPWPVEPVTHVEGSTRP